MTGMAPAVASVRSVGLGSIMRPKQIQELRRELRLTQDELAERLGVTRRTVIRWEAGVSMPHPVFDARLKEMRP